MRRSPPIHALVLFGVGESVIDAAAPLEYSWSVAGEASKSSSCLLMPECAVSGASVALENAASPTLKVPENVLSPGRYVFTMTVTDVNNGGLTATAKMAVVINSPPTQGIVLVEPLSGTELVDTFRLFFRTVVHGVKIRSIGCDIVDKKSK